MRPLKHTVKKTMDLAIHHFAPALARMGVAITPQGALDVLQADNERLRKEVETLRRGLPVGSFCAALAPDQELSPEETRIVDAFHDLYYRRWQAGHSTISISWFGHETLKCPLDLWIYQELIVKIRPDFIIETGTCHGGSAYYLASLCQLSGHGRVITIDCAKDPTSPQHERITYLNGMSTDPAIVREVEKMVGSSKNCLVILDSDHSCENVLSELKIYNRFVPLDGYLIVEDTNVNGHPTYPEFGPGPMEAVQSFLAENRDFDISPECERFMMTLNPRGYLRRVRA